jgi:hypothetical protein
MPDYSHLLDAQVDDAMATFIRPIPEGDYKARIDSLEIVSISINKGQNAGKEMPQAVILWEILDEGLTAQLGRTPKVRQQAWLDLDATGNLDTGPDKNVRLGQIREALGLNGAGFRLGQLKGSLPCLIHVTQRPNEQNPDAPYNDVSRVTKLR